MVRRILFYLFVIASIAGAIYGYLYLSKSKEPQSEITEHIPSNAMFVLYTQDFEQFNKTLVHQNLIWNALKDNKHVVKINSVIHYFDSLRLENDDLKNLLDDNAIYWSVIKENASFHHLLIVKFKEQAQQDLILDLVESKFQKNTSAEAFDLYEFKTSGMSWNVSVKNGLLYFSSDVSLLEKSISMPIQESIRNNEQFNSLFKNIGYQKNVVYVNHQLSSFMDKSLMSGNSIMSADVQLNAVNFTGYTIFDSLAFINSFSNQEAPQISLYAYLPNNPLRIFGYGFHDLNSVYDDLNEKQKIENNIQESWKDLSDSALYDIKKEMFSNIIDEFVHAKYIINQSERSIVSFKVDDEEKLNSFMNLVIDTVIEESATKIYQIKDISHHLFSFFPYLDKLSYIIIDNRQVYAFSDKEILNYYLESESNGSVLSKNKAFSEYANDNMNQACNFMYYENLELVRENNANSVFNLPDFIFAEKAVNQVSYSLKNYQTGMQCRFNFSKATQQNDLQNKTNSLWTFKADSSIYTPVFLFKNHNTSENELCFQDDLNKLYLTSSTGNLLWKKQINERILSEIYTVDIFKNGKYQLLFNTTNYLHLVDRNGNYVDGYPVKLPAEVSSSITLLDYDNTKDYRLFIACKDKRIYNYSIYGIKTEGFVPVKTNAVVNLPIYYTKVGASDYLITADVEGKIYVFSRKGEGRIELKNKTIEGLDNMHVVIGNSLLNTKIVYMDDKNNLLNKISLNDAKETIKFGDDLANFKSYYTLINDDVQTDIVMVGDGAIYAYDLFSTKLFEYFNSTSYYSDIEQVSGNTNEYFVAHNNAGQKNELISINGKLIKEIPATKKALICNLYRNDKRYLINVLNNMISCEEIN